MPKIIPLKDLKDTSAVSLMCRESNEPIYITKNGYGEMVIMSMDSYEHHLVIRDIYQKIAEAERDFAQGRIIDAKESLKRLREKHGL